MTDEESPIDQPAPAHPGTVIYRALMERTWSQRSLARRTGLHETTISQIIRGVARVSPHGAREIGKVLDIDPRILLAMQQAWDDAQRPST